MARPAKRTPLSRDRILDRAIELADEGGIETLSMRKLGEALGVRAMSLYKHVANKDEVLDGLVERVVEEIEVPRVGRPWKREMRKRANSAHEALLRHPWATWLFLSRVNTGPGMLRYVDCTVGCLLEAGFSVAMADHAWNAMDNHIYGFTLQKLNFPFEPEEYAEVAKQYLPMIPRETYPYMHQMSVELIEGRHNGLNEFSFGLDLILDGLARRLRSAKPTSKRGQSRS